MIILVKKTDRPKLFTAADFDKPATESPLRLRRKVKLRTKVSD